jgi:ATP-binding protein involved in chromosome partitioning
MGPPKAPQRRHTRAKPDGLLAQGGHQRLECVHTETIRKPTMAITEQQVQEALKQLIDPNTKKDYVSSKSARNIKVSGEDVSVDILLGYPARSQLEPIRRQVAEKLRSLPGVGRVTVNVAMKIVSHAVQRGVKLIPGVKNIIAVASGKGGVGKSTTAVNLALALAAEGASVGILDADIYGPSQPMMLGITGRPESKDGKTLEPMEGHGIQAMSIGFLIDVETPMVWRGPMVTQALEQLLNETRWRDVDYLVVDLPPGTGDIQLTLAQRVPVTGAIIVTTPQDIALIDARKGLRMFEKVGIPILGVVENMSIHICSKCGHEERIFGEGGGERMGRDYGVELLGALPLDIRIREETDSGKPTVVSDPDGRIAQIYKEIARRVAVKIAEKQQDHSAVFPKIVVQNT